MTNVNTLDRSVEFYSYFSAGVFSGITPNIKVKQHVSLTFLVKLNKIPMECFELFLRLMGKTVRLSMSGIKDSMWKTVAG